MCGVCVCVCVFLCLCVCVLPQPKKKDLKLEGVWILCHGAVITKNTAAVGPSFPQHSVEVI